MIIREIMTTQIVTLKVDSKIYEAQELMKDKDIEFIPIIEEEKIVGIITDKDLIKKQIENNKSIEIYFNKEIREIMKTTFDFVYETDNEKDVYELMIKNHRRRFPVVNNNKELVGVVSLTDLNAERIQ